MLYQRQVSRTGTVIYIPQFLWNIINYTPCSMKLKGDILVSPCPAGGPSIWPASCLSLDRIVSALYFLQYPPDPFDIYTPAKRSWRGGILDSPCPAVCPSVRPSVCRRHGFRSISQVCFGISISNFICILMVAIGRSLLMSLSKWPPGGHIGFFGFRTLTLLWISTSNFRGTILMYMCRSLLIFSNVIFKMAAWWPY